jgi:GNAT superfamily N-acetyltransferase
MPQLPQMLYSTKYYNFAQVPDLGAYIKNREQLANYDFDGLTIKLAETKDFYTLTQSVDKYRDGVRITDRLARGDVCVVAYKHGTLAHVRWGARTPIPLKELGGRIIHLGCHDGWTYDSYTLPAFRRQGIASEARNFLINYLAQHGVQFIYSISRTDNVNVQPMRVKRIREGRVRMLGLITVTNLLGWVRCNFFAETAYTRPLIAQLFHLPLTTVGFKTWNAS